MDTRLAALGGHPVRSAMLPYGGQHIDDDDIGEVVETLKSDFLTCGPRIDRFEKETAGYVGARYAAAVNSGTAALHAACFAAGVKSGDEVITTSMTFAASANCILYMGARPVFADICPETCNIDPKDIERKITPRTKAIIPVDYTGLPADLDEINRIAEKHSLTVIEDAAHALGAEYKGRKIGSVSHMTIFSFHPVKHITTGEGGMVTTDNSEFYEKLRMFRTHGITRDPDKLHDNHGNWYYEMLDLGYNYRITDIQAALGTSQLRKLDGFLERRRELVQIYNNEFTQVKGIITPYTDSDCRSAWHLYIIRLDLGKLSVGRKTVFDALRAENIGVNVHYIPVYYHPYYRKMGYVKGLCPNAERLYEEIVTLPLFPSMSNRDAEDVVTAVKKVINYYRK